MKLFLLSIIKLYWILIPAHKRRLCVFHKSCSNQVYETIKNCGVKSGINELIFRMNNCNSEIDIYIDFTTGRKKMLLKSGKILDENQIAESLR